MAFKRYEAQAGQLELNVMLPLIAYNLIQSIEILGKTLAVLTERYMKEIMADSDRCLALVTALNPHIGYLNAAAVAQESLETGKSLRQIALEQGLMSPEALAQVLDLEKMSAMHTLEEERGTRENPTPMSVELNCVLVLIKRASSRRCIIKIT